MSTAIQVEANAAAERLSRKLAGVEGCRPQDLACNHEGRLSLEQRSMLLLMHFWRGVGLLVGMGFIAWFFAAAGFQLIPAVGVVCVLWEAWRLVRDTVEVRRGQTTELVGAGIPVVERDDDGDEYYLEIEGRRLVLTREQFNALDPGGPYRVYYLHGSRQVVGIEVLPGWQPEPAPTEAPKPFRLPLRIQFGE